jgi:hypothetical protein
LNNQLKQQQTIVKKSMDELKRATRNWQDAGKEVRRYEKKRHTLEYPRRIKELQDIYAAKEIAKNGAQTKMDNESKNLTSLKQQLAKIGTLKTMTRRLNDDVKIAQRAIK